MGEVALERVVNEEVTVVLLGAGRVATHLAPALVGAGYKLLQIWSRTETSARTLAQSLGVPHTDNLDAVVPDADVYIACVADGALPEVARKVVSHSLQQRQVGIDGQDASSGAGRGSLFLHTAGSVSMDVWREAGATHYGILYPLQTFSKERAVNMHDVSLFIEASDAKAKVKTEALARRLSEKVFWADSERRARLHIAAVFACNFTNAMYDVAHRLLASDNISFDVLLPLIDETTKKVHTLTPHEAQTGPAVRGDENVMQRHIDALAEDKDLQQLYQAISQLIQENTHNS